MISLVGMPGSGKSTIGRQLARQLQLPHVDVDAAIEASIGCPIKLFFEQSGEQSFRKIEKAFISTLVDESGIVSTGGGAVLDESNCQHLKSHGQVVYLHSTPEDLYRRLRNDSHRPLLQVVDPLSKLREMYLQRDPLYRKVASIVVETGRPSVASLVKVIAMQLQP